MKIVDSTAYVCSSPIQVLNILNIALYENASLKMLLYIDSSGRFKNFCDKLHEIDLISDIYVFKSEELAFKWLINAQNRVTKLYIDSDINKAKYLFALRTAEIMVYEEGIGTYRSQHFFPRTFIGKVYRKCLSIFGYKNFRGGDYYCRGVVVYNPSYYRNNIYRKKLIRKFPLNFIQAIDRFSAFKAFSVDNVFPELNNIEVAIVLGDWHGFGTMIEDANRENETVLIKAHPKAPITFSFNNFQKVIPQEIPVEFLIRELLMRSCTLTIYSFRSSAVFYFEAEGIVHHKKYSSGDSEYNLSYCSIYDAMLAEVKN